MRFTEFSNRKIGETIPAVTGKDLRSLNPATLQATKNLAGKIGNKIATAIGGKPDPTADKTPMPPGVQAQATVQPSAIQQAKAADAVKKAPENHSEIDYLDIPAFLRRQEEEV
jgi:hypothetical protein